MTVSASQLFDFLAAHPQFDATRHEISDSTFSVFRRNVRSIVVGLFEADTLDAIELANAFRRVLSENLTVPLPFDQSLLESLDLLGDVDLLGDRWGSGIRDAFKFAGEAIQDLQGVENPVRETLRAIIQEQRAQGRTFRIMCYRAARPHFETILPSEGPNIEPAVFLHSVQDYRNTDLFDVLIKMGPLRSRGWGAVPDAILSAPRFGSLEQVVWSGCHDEENFGYDPVVGTLPQDGGSKPESASGAPKWNVRTIRRERDTGGSAPTDGDAPPMPDLDDLGIMLTARKSEEETTKAVLVQIDAAHGILYRPLAQVLSFAPDVDGPLAFASRLPGETLGVGMYVIVRALADVDLGGSQADEGYYSGQWKHRLSEEYAKAPVELVRRLRAAGIDLRLPHQAIRHWRTPASTVIHAPQQRQHFEALIGVLGLDQERPAGGSRASWAQLAWHEIGMSRGEAIQSGMQEHDLVGEELKRILVGLSSTLREKAQTGDSFQIEIPAGQTLSGVVKFYRVLSVEDGFQVPNQYVHTISELGLVEQWRS